MWEVIVKLSQKRLTKSQKLVLRKIALLNRDVTMSTLIRELSEDLGLGQSTVRVVLQTLRDVGLILCGCEKNKGVAVKLTPIGRRIVKVL